MLSFRKDFEMVSISTKIEDEQALVIQLQKKIKELQVLMANASKTYKAKPSSSHKTGYTH